jgi:colanic acid biosynthesis protein WcaH
MIIPEKQYKQIINSTVNLCVDVCLRYNDKVLLIKRTEEPCKGVFWPVGGRIHKGEKAIEAARRKIKEEIGIDFKVSVNSAIITSIICSHFDENVI